MAEGMKATTIVGIIIALLIGIGIGYGVAMATIPRAPPPAPPAPPAKEVKIGVILPISGALAATAEDLKRGIEFAVSEINEAGGIKSLDGAKIKIVYGDSEAEPSIGATEAERLITTENVVAILGAYQSSVTKTVSSVCERYEVPMVNPDSTSPDLTERGLKWFFRTTAHDDPFCKQHFEFLDWLKSEYGVNITTVAVLCEDTEWGMGCYDRWQKYAAEFGYEVVAAITYHRGATSLDAEVGTLKAANPDVLFVAAYVTDGILLQKTFKKLDFNPKAVIAMDAGYINPAFIEETGELSYYVFSREVFNWDLFEVVPKLAEKNAEYKAKYGVDFDGNSARDYTGMWTLYWALEEAGKVAKPWEDLKAFRKALRDALAELEIPAEELIMPWKGIKFDENGQNILATGIIVQMSPEDGKYHTVWPREIATMDPIFPMPTWAERE